MGDVVALIVVAVGYIDESHLGGQRVGGGQLKRRSKRLGPGEVHRKRFTDDRCVIEEGDVAVVEDDLKIQSESGCPWVCRWPIGNLQELRHDVGRDQPRDFNEVFGEGDIAQVAFPEEERAVVQYCRHSKAFRRRDRQVVDIISLEDLGGDCLRRVAVTDRKAIAVYLHDGGGDQDDSRCGLLTVRNRYHVHGGSVL